jgi:DNA-binding protein HU-beta
MKKSEIVTALAARSQLNKKKTLEVIDHLCDIIMEEVAEGNDVQLYNFGTFGCSLRQKRTGINPQTKEKICIPEHYLPIFKAGEAFKTKVKEGQAK